MAIGELSGGVCVDKLLAESASHAVVVTNIDQGLDRHFWGFIDAATVVLILVGPSHSTVYAGRKDGGISQAYTRESYEEPSL